MLIYIWSLYIAVFEHFYVVTLTITPYFFLVMLQVIVGRFVHSSQKRTKTAGNNEVTVVVSLPEEGSAAFLITATIAMHKLWPICL